MSLTLHELNDHVLLRIFDFCTIDDVLQLYNVCKRFKALIQHTTFRRKSLDLLAVGHRNHDAIAYRRTLRELTYFKRITMGNNWCNGRYQERVLFHQPFFRPSRIVLEREFLYKSFGGQLQKCLRSPNDGHIRTMPILKTFGSIDDQPITSMVKFDDTVFIGRANGNVKIMMVNDIDNDSDETHVAQTPAQYCYEAVESVDLVEGLCVTSTLRQGSLWRISYELALPYLDKIYDLDSGYKCVRFSPNADCLALGKYRAFEKYKQALRFLDIETNVETPANTIVGSIYDVTWKDSNVVLAGSFDATLRLFDRRTNRTECTWEDPFDLAVYSVSYDGDYGVLCGLQYYCRVNLCDLRVPKRPVQLYFPTRKVYEWGCMDLTKSPAYQVTSDQSELFIATDRNVRVLNFDADWAEKKDNANLYPRSVHR